MPTSEPRRPALHRNRHRRRLCAAALLVLLARTATIHAQEPPALVPAAVTGITDGTPDDSARATATVPADTLVFVDSSAFVYSGTPRASLYGPLPLARTHIDPVRAGITGGIFGGILVGLHLNMKHAWWSEGASFHWKNDWDDVLQVDKCGHALAGYLMSYGMSEALMASGVGYDAATIAGTALGLGYQTYVELQDGYSESWGFSPSDMAANTIGAGLFLAQHYLPALQHVTPKYLYVPPSWLGSPQISTTWIDNYNSSSFWLAVDLHALLPAPAREWWPSWLGAAVGYSVAIDGVSRERRVTVALDYDLRRLLPSGGHVWNWIRQTMNFVKLPAPAVSFGRSTRVHLLFPFSFTIGGSRVF